MKTLGITIAVGLGDAIFIAAALNNVKDKYDKITVNVRWDIAETYKNDGKGYSAFYREILKLLFADPKFIIDDKTQKLPFAGMHELWSWGIPPVLPRFGKILKTTEPFSIEGEYIVVTTKVRQLDKKVYDKIKPKFLAHLKKLSAKNKIVIIGERKIEMNREYEHYSSRFIYSIYNDIVGAVKNNLIDLTVPKLGITVPDIETLKRDCSIMNNAKCVITFGCGGNFILATAVAKRIIAFRKDDYNFVSHAFIGVHQFLQTRNIKEFIQKVANL